MSTQLVALNSNWLDQVTAPPINTLTSGGITSGTMTIQYDTCYGHPSWWYPVYVSSPSRPIRLSLREVERLRDAARNDAALKAILEKFTPQIEVQMSLE